MIVIYMMSMDIESILMGPFAGRILQFIRSVFVYEHIYRGNFICNTYCHLGSGSVCSFNWKYAGIWEVLFLLTPFKLLRTVLFSEFHGCKFCFLCSSYLKLGNDLEMLGSPWFDLFVVNITVSQNRVKV